MQRAPQGVHDFLRAYYHHKSADWKANKPYPLQVMDRGRTGKTADLLRDGSAPAPWPRPSLRKCRRRPRSPPTHGCPTANSPSTAAEYARTGFQGGLQWYRCGTSGAFTAELADLVGPQHRRALLLHLGQAGLGHLSAPRRIRGDAGQRLHPHARLSSGRWRRPLGAAGAACRGKPAAAGIFCAKRGAAE